MKTKKLHSNLIVSYCKEQTIINFRISKSPELFFEFHHNFQISDIPE